MQKREKFDNIVIETTGLANPGPVATALWTDEELEAGVCLDAIVTVVDAKHIRRQLQARPESGTVNEAQQQIAYADVVILNKVDLVTQEEADEIEEEVKAINSTVSITRTIRSRVDINAVLNRGTYRGGRARGGARQWADGLTRNCSGDGGQQMPCEGHADCGDVHSQQVTTVSVTASQAVDKEKVKTWLDTLLWENDNLWDIFRMKGILNVQGSDRQHFMQAVHEMYELTEGDEWRSSDTRISKVVIIGLQLSHSQLQASFADCVAT
ncbi:unnamed protein product [Ostreobium quekettii]|uniref:CobW C-terminal domain-containing protein n=1 Tax=Ostreobium quekettii TaxID=121088 RepID=A0A8S1J652_9CHLO|nr:unnamed protein product [Ostreobium quekettii]|eukprot:evm.model.scf_808.5 EVM.evm.TU.scf_808.5   scf_808:20709-21621(+)